MIKYRSTLKIHRVTGSIISIFVLLHLLNHLTSLMGVQTHIDVMNSLRVFYRNPIAESILLVAVLVQIISGIKQFRTRRKISKGFFDQLKLWSGVYLAVFFVMHITAVLVGRNILDLDTNLYFGAAGLNTFPFMLFFVPYYSLAVFSFFGHLAGVYHVKVKKDIFGLSPDSQSYILLGFGAIITLTILYGLTDGFAGITIPSDYDVMIGK